MLNFKEFKQNHLRPGLFFFSIILSITMLVAARWQWTRYHEKLELVETFKSNNESSEISIKVTDLDQNNYAHILNKKITVSGYFDLTNQLIISNRRAKSGAGSWILTPFKLAHSNKSLMVSRGFIPYEDRDIGSWKKYDLPVGINEDQPIEIKGVLAKSTGKRSSLSPSANTKNPKIFLYPDMNLVAKTIPYPIFDFVYLHGILDPVFGEYPLTDIKIDVPPSTHFWYTFEWIGLAILTQIICFFVQLFRPKNRYSNPQSKLLLANLSLILSTFVLLFPTNSLATPDPKSVPQKAGIIERLNESIDLSLEFERDDGSKVILGDFFDKKRPVIIAPVYFECPRLCSLTQEGLLKSISTSDLKIGPDYTVLSISFNDLETSKQSSKRAAAYREKFPPTLKGNENFWNFLTGKKESTEKLMNQLGFKYEYDQGEFMHAAGIIILTPEGKISRYLYGIEYPPTDYKLSLVEAAEGKIGSFMNRALMFCFRYDHIKGQYTLAIWQIIRIVCSGFVILLLAYVYYLKKRENN